MGAAIKGRMLQEMGHASLPLFLLKRAHAHHEAELRGVPWLIVG